MKVLTSSSLVSYRENTSPIYRFHTNGFLVQWLIVSVSIFAIKMSAKETAIICSHCGAVYPKVVFYDKLERVFL